MNGERHQQGEQGALGDASPVHPSPTAHQVGRGASASLPDDAPEAVLVYVTAANAEEARSLARKAVEQRLAACANVYPQIHSFYWWQGELVEDQEAVVVFKTAAEQFPSLMGAVRRWHRYQVPAILALPVRDGLPEYLDWLRTEIAQGTAPQARTQG